MTRAFIDANVIVQSWTLDVLLSLAEDDLFEPVWSARVMDEARNAICRARGCPASMADAYVKTIEDAFPDAMAPQGVELEGRLVLPDPNDRHVAAAAIAGDCGVLVTHNIRDFPNDVLAPYGVIAMSPDEFVLMLACEDEEAVLDAARRVVTSKRHPPRTMEQEVAGLRRNGLVRFADLLDAESI